MTPNQTQRVIESLCARLAAAEADTMRLDWLEAHRMALNALHSTSYGWRFIANQNVTRLLVRDVATVDLNDMEPHGPDIRTAIDAEMRCSAKIEGKLFRVQMLLRALAETAPQTPTE